MLIVEYLNQSCVDHNRSSNTLQHRNESTWVVHGVKRWAVMGLSFKTTGDLVMISLSVIIVGKLYLLCSTNSTILDRVLSHIVVCCSRYIYCWHPRSQIVYKWSTLHIVTPRFVNYPVKVTWTCYHYDFNAIWLVLGRCVDTSNGGLANVDGSLIIIIGDTTPYSYITLALGTIFFFFL